MFEVSYSSLAQVIKCPKSWLCKINGYETHDFKWFKEGKDIHAIIQEHVSGTKEHSFLTQCGITKDYHFPMVEEKDFDEKMKFTFEVVADGVPFLMRGYLDGLNPEIKRGLEIKSGSALWSLGDFIKSPQRRIYALALDLKDMLLITVKRDMNLWETDPKRSLKKYLVPTTELDKKSAMEFIKLGCHIILKSEYKAPENRNCFNCIYKGSCEDSLCLNRR